MGGSPTHKKPDYPNHAQTLLCFPISKPTLLPTEFLIGNKQPPGSKCPLLCLPVHPQGPTDRRAQSNLLTNGQQVGLWLLQSPEAQLVAALCWADNSPFTHSLETQTEKRACLFPLCTNAQGVCGHSACQ